jgi:hypothetical protein
MNRVCLLLVTGITTRMLLVSESSLVGNLCGVGEEDVDEKVEKFFDEQLGLQVRRQLPRHKLIGQDYYQGCTDAKGQRKVIRGVITHCWEHLVGKDRYTTQYNHHGKAAPSMSDCNSEIPAFGHVPEKMAWGGYTAFWRQELALDIHIDFFTTVLFYLGNNPEIK